MLQRHHFPARTLSSNRDSVTIIMNKSIVTACLIGFSAIFQASAQLAITEVMSGENDANHPDWFELHNYGTNDIDLTGYSWNDDGHSGFSGADTAAFTGITIHSNETIVCTELKGAVTDPASFRAWWNDLDSGIQVVVLSSGDPGLSANPLEIGVNRADSVRLWRTNLAALGADTTGLDLDECPDYLVQRVDLGVATNQSLLFDPASGTYNLVSTDWYCWSLCLHEWRSRLAGRRAERGGSQHRANAGSIRP